MGMRTWNLTFPKNNYEYTMINIIWLYVNNANSILQTIDKARAEGADFNFKAHARPLAFNLGGIILHDYFWWEMTPESNASKEPVGELFEAIKEDFGNFEVFKKEFSQVALSVEGSGVGSINLVQRY